MLFSELARRHANDHFCFSVIVEKWLKLYGEVPDEAHSSENDETRANVDLVVVK
jgi:hypothetical protein